eukprot:3764641-Rhodomonas_salina.1
MAMEMKIPQIGATCFSNRSDPTTAVAPAAPAPPLPEQPSHFNVQCSHTFLHAIPSRGELTLQRTH